MPYTVINGPVIAMDEALSDSVDLGVDARVARITTPAFLPQIPGDDGFDGRTITFQISDDDILFYDMWVQAAGNETPQEAALRIAPSTGVVIPKNWPSFRYMKIRSGRSAGPTMQHQRREFSVCVFNP